MFSHSVTTEQLPWVRTACGVSRGGGNSLGLEAGGWPRVTVTDAASTVR